MVDAVKKGDLASYVAAAGLVAHYVGDASQPLHGSYVSDGVKGEITGVHSAYETTMIDRHDQDVIQGIQAKLPGMPTQPLVKTGKDAAIAVVEQHAGTRLAFGRVVSCRLNWHPTDSDTTD